MGLHVLLDRVPELVALILEHLEKKVDLNLKAFSLASQNCRTLALPYIFSKTVTLYIATPRRTPEMLERDLVDERIKPLIR